MFGVVFTCRHAVRGSRIVRSHLKCRVESELILDECLKEDLPIHVKRTWDFKKFGCN